MHDLPASHSIAQIKREQLRERRKLLKAELLDRPQTMETTSRPERKSATEYSGIHYKLLDSSLTAECTISPDTVYVGLLPARRPCPEQVLSLAQELSNRADDMPNAILVALYDRDHPVSRATRTELGDLGIVLLPAPRGWDRTRRQPRREDLLHAAYGEYFRTLLAIDPAPTSPASVARTPEERPYATRNPSAEQELAALNERLSHRSSNDYL